MQSMKRSLQQFSPLDPKPLEAAASLCGWLSWLLKKHPESDRESGLTLIEALMAVLILAVVIGSIAPPLVIAVSTRVRNREVEQSLQVSRKHIEDIRIALLNNSWDGDPDTIPSGVPKLASASDYSSGSVPYPPDLTQIKPPSDVCTTPGVPSGTEACDSALDMQGFDFDKDGKVDFFVQAFRANQCSTADEIFAFDVGVRVYPYDVVKTDGTLVSSITNEDQGAAFADRRNNNAPLSSGYTTLIRTEATFGLTNYNDSCPKAP